MSTDGTSARASFAIPYTTFICNNDVILGRGLSSMKHPGNVFFRNLIKEKRSKYASSCRRKLKQDVSKEILSIMLQRNSRFVREVKTSEELIEMGFPSTNGTKIWIIADHSTILQKIKQALREFDGKSEVKKETRNVSQNKLAKTQTREGDQCRVSQPATESLTLTAFDDTSSSALTSNINPVHYQNMPGLNTSFRSSSSHRDLRRIKNFASAPINNPITSMSDSYSIINSNRTGDSDSKDVVTEKSQEKRVDMKTPESGRLRDLANSNFRLRATKPISHEEPSQLIISKPVGCRRTR